jgi:pantoate--beta-alanine ligase
MHVVHGPEEMRQLANEARSRGETVGVVPTMGALHEGHATLVREAARRASYVIVTIFVNPTQFGPNEDLAKYPRTLDADVALSTAGGAQVVFAPDVEAMYPRGDETRVRVGTTARALCGEFRPTHFEGVATIVTKLLVLAGPSIACFGKKDYQQLQVIRRLVTDLFLPVEVVSVPTVREIDGVALSSRNRYLDAGARERARRIPEGLSLAHAAFERGERSPARLADLVRSRVGPVADSIDYVTVADPTTVEPIDASGRTAERALLALAVRIGGARLIDNVVLGEDPAPIPRFAVESAEGRAT